MSRSIQTYHKFILILTLTSAITSGTVEFKQYDIDAQPVDLVWCGANREIVFVVSGFGSLYISNDRGFSWRKLNDVLMNTGKSELDENDKEV
jgi:hypothetical protein